MPTDVADKDLPDIKPADIKVDISVVDAMDEKTLVAATDMRGIGSLDNNRLLELLERYPEKIKILQKQVDLDKAMTPELAVLLDKPLPDPDGSKNTEEKIARLKEKYGLVVKQIQMKKEATKEPIKDVG